MSQITEPQKNYLQKISSLPTGLPKPLKLQRPHQPQTNTSTPTGRKLTSFSSQSHFFSSQKQKSHLPSALSTHTKQQVDQSFNSISSRIENEQEKQNLMKKQSIYLYIKKYLNAQEGNVTKMKFKNRYAMYRPEPTTERKDFKQTTKGYLPRVNSSVDKSMTQRRSRNGEFDITLVKTSKKAKLLSSQNQNLHSSRQSNISSRRRVNQMLKRDKQLNNLHRNGHHVHSHSSSKETKNKTKLSNNLSKSKSKQKKVNSIISERFETLEEGVQVNMEEETLERERLERERLQIIEKERIEREERQKQRLSKMKQQITTQIMQKITQKHQQTLQAQQQYQALQQLSLTQQLSMLENRQNQFNLFVQKVQEQHSFKNLAQLKEIIDNSLPLQGKKQVVDKEVSCKLMDAQEMTLKEKERLEREVEMQRLRQELEKVKESERVLKREKQWDVLRVQGQQGIEKELREKLELLKKQLEEQVKGKLSLMQEKQQLEKKQLQNKQRQKQLQQDLYKQRNKYEHQSLNSALNLISKLNNRAQNIESTLDKKQSNQQQISHITQLIFGTKQQSQLSKIQSLQSQLKHQQKSVKEKINEINKHLKQEHQKYLKLLQVRKSQTHERKQSLQLSHLSLRQKVADMELLKQQLKNLKDELEIIAIKQKQANEKYQQKIEELKRAKSTKPQMKQRKLNQQLVNDKNVRNDESLLKLANECSWGLFPIQETKEQQTVNFTLHLKKQQERNKSNQQREKQYGSDNLLGRRNIKLRSREVNDKIVDQRQDQLLLNTENQIEKERDRYDVKDYEQGTYQNINQSDIQITNRPNHQTSPKTYSSSHQSQQTPFIESSHQQLPIAKHLNTSQIPEQTNDYDDLDFQQQVSASQRSNSQLELHYFENNHPRSDQSNEDYYDQGSQSQFQCYQEF